MKKIANKVIQLRVSTRILPRPKAKMRIKIKAYEKIEKMCENV